MVRRSVVRTGKSIFQRALTCGRVGGSEEPVPLRPSHPVVPSSSSTSSHRHRHHTVHPSGYNTITQPSAQTRLTGAALSSTQCRGDEYPSRFAPDRIAARTKQTSQEAPSLKEEAAKSFNAPDIKCIDVIIMSAMNRDRKTLQGWSWALSWIACRSLLSRSQDLGPSTHATQKAIRCR